MSAVNVVVALISLVFSAGVTWGIMGARQKATKESTDQTVKDLKECVHKLEGLCSEMQVMKILSAQHSKDLEDLDNRVKALEIANAKRKR